MSGDCGAVGLWSMKGMDAETRTCREPPPPLDVAGETGEMIDVEVPTVATPLVRDALYSETSQTKNMFYIISLHHLTKEKFLLLTLLFSANNYCVLQLKGFLI